MREYRIEGIVSNIKESLTLFKYNFTTIEAIEGLLFDSFKFNNIKKILIL